MSSPASYGGMLLFGSAVSIVHIPNSNAQQVNHFFGISGSVTLYGGARGRLFLVSGVLTADNLTDLNSVEATLLSYADGVARSLVDTRGRTWTNVIFRGEFRPARTGPMPTDNGLCLPYRAVFHGLT
jgi:hypothetical protein